MHSWDEVVRGARPPGPTDEGVARRDWPHGWQHDASRTRNIYFRTHFAAFHDAGRQSRPASKYMAGCHPKRARHHAAAPKHAAGPAPLSASSSGTPPTRLRSTRGCLLARKAKSLERAWARVAGRPSALRAKWSPSNGLRTPLRHASLLTIVAAWIPCCSARRRSEGSLCGDATLVSTYSCASVRSTSRRSTSPTTRARTHPLACAGRLCGRLGWLKRPVLAPQHAHAARQRGARVCSQLSRRAICARVRW